LPSQLVLFTGKENVLSLGSKTEFGCSDSVF
jgi:hypothetical protein